MAKYNLTKNAGGVFTPASDLEAKRLERLKTGCVFEVEIVQRRNPKFHGKVFAFFNYVFECWHQGHEFHDEDKQFETFRKELTILAGFYFETYDINGNLKLEAESLSYENMEPEEFERCYNALIRAAIVNVPAVADDENRLLSFFN
jgi:hypothetical protein